MLVTFRDSHKFIDKLISKALTFKHVTKDDIKTSTVHVVYSKDRWYGWIELFKNPSPEKDWFPNKLAYAMTGPYKPEFSIEATSYFAGLIKEI